MHAICQYNRALSAAACRPFDVGLSRAVQKVVQAALRRLIGYSLIG
jgi:hypothetical protein